MVEHVYLRTDHLAAVASAAVAAASAALEFDSAEAVVQTTESGRAKVH